MTDTGGKYSPVGRDQNVHANTDRTLKFPTTDAAGAALDTSGYTREWILYDASGTVLLTVPESAISEESLNGTNDQVLVPWTATGVAYANENLTRGRNYSHKLWKIDSGAREVLAYGPFEIVG